MVCAVTAGDCCLVAASRALQLCWSGTSDGLQNDKKAHPVCITKTRRCVQRIYRKGTERGSKTFLALISLSLTLSLRCHFLRTSSGLFVLSDWRYMITPAAHIPGNVAHPCQYIIVQYTMICSQYTSVAVDVRIDAADSGS